jgi:crossover junction endodeoxyribonuclease RusA
MVAIQAWAPGVAVPQGSMKHVGRGIIRHSNANGIALYRAQVAASVAKDIEGLAVSLPLEGPLVLDATFIVARPKSAPRKRVWPDRRPDLDKMLRSLGDALTEAGVWLDDAQVVQIVATKIYVGSVADSHGVPGTAFRVATL